MRVTPRSDSDLPEPPFDSLIALVSATIGAGSPPQAEPGEEWCPDVPNDGLRLHNAG
ncbi:hypothetical protein QTO31_01510 [Chloroflexus sp. MS-CIW-1]|uniref:hypothetical protein n=1 Tax=Chloroflexus sp. MS-CIW-1 TaxID=3055768 RepID=UPI001B1A75C5|nr:hypothetical protein [Chloroflexus sp. MS-CIW-1]MBO9347355.1 hypothetical protein [Chloroflexus sp.]MDN5270641.1 hypothetical protein [Chloroflexus sp. MS-CIW-1]